MNDRLKIVYSLEFTSIIFMQHGIQFVASSSLPLSFFFSLYRSHFLISWEEGNFFYSKVIQETEKYMHCSFLVSLRIFFSLFIEGLKTFFINLFLLFSLSLSLYLVGIVVVCAILKRYNNFKTCTTFIYIYILLFE